METTLNIEALLKRPIAAMTGEEFCELTRYANRLSERKETGESTQVKGLAALAEALDCSLSYVHSLRHKGVLDGAIVQYYGKQIIFDVDKAKALISATKENKMKLKRAVRS